MSEAGTIENDHAMRFSREAEKTTRFEIFDLRAVAVNEQQGLSCSAFDVVQAHPVDIKELAKRWMTLFRADRLSPGNQRHGAKTSASQRRRNCIFPRIQG